MVGTLYVYLLEIGFVYTTANPCLCILDTEGVLLMVYVEGILLSGDDEEQVFTIVEQLKERFETVDLGDARFFLGMRIQRNINAGTIILTQET